MNKKEVIIISIVVIAIVAAAILIPKQFRKPEPYHSDDPKTWVNEISENKKEIDIDRVTKGRAYQNFNGIQVRSDSIETVFSSEGWYQGRYFRNYYQDGNGKVLMKISTEMDPLNGIIEGLVVDDIVDNTAIVYIFLDRDWRDNIKNTKIYWGKTYQLQKDFDFSQEISDGIYMNMVQDDMARFSNNFALHQGGIWVGDLREDNISTIISLN